MFRYGSIVGELLERLRRLDDRQIHGRLWKFGSELIVETPAHDRRLTKDPPHQAHWDAGQTGKQPADDAACQSRKLPSRTAQNLTSHRIACIGSRQHQWKEARKIGRG